MAVALAAHRVFDLAHAALIANSGVTDWWADLCFACDVTAAVYLALLVQRGRSRVVRATPSGS